MRRLLNDFRLLSLAVMALLNKWLELRSDAFKIAKQFRRPIPTRTDTIGPWLEAMVCCGFSLPAILIRLLTKNFYAF